MFNLCLTTPLGLTSNLQKMERKEKEVKYFHKETISQIQNVRYSTRQIAWTLQNVNVVKREKEGQKIGGGNRSTLQHCRDKTTKCNAWIF